jgi:hypothetical protein
MFDTIANIVKRITGNTVGDLASKLVVSAGKSMAPEAGKRLATRFIATPPQPPSSVLTRAPQNVVIPQPGFTPTPSITLPQNAVNHQAKLTR